MSADPASSFPGARVSLISDGSVSGIRRHERRAAELAFLEPIARDGVEHYMEAAPGLTMELRHVGQHMIPLLVSDGRSGKPAFASPRAHYLAYPMHEMTRSRPWPMRSLLRILLLPLDLVLAWGRIDRVVYVNHWLFAGGPPLRLGRLEIEELINDLIRDYPDHALVFSGIVPDLHSQPAAALNQTGCRAVQSRVVHLLDGGASLRGQAMKPVRDSRGADRQLHQRNEFRRTTDPAILLSQVDRLRELYAQLYLQRHPGHLNPRYRPSFFRIVVESGLFSIVGWQQGEVVDTFNAQHVSDGVVSASLCGAEADRVEKDGLFRLLAAEDFVVAERQKLTVNWGGGNARFKRLRGGRPSFEYDFVVDWHLGKRRRLPWWLMQRLRMWKNRAPRVPRPRAEAAE